MDEMSVQAIGRFWAAVVKTDGCWLWMRARTRAGYGELMIAGRMWYAHRLSYELHHGPIPAGMMVCHTCDTPNCVAPTHLFLGTNGVNMADAYGKGRLPDFVPGYWGRVPATERPPAGRCRRGHELTGENRTARGCAICRREVGQEYDRVHRERRNECRRVRRARQRELGVACE